MAGPASTTTDGMADWPSEQPPSSSWIFLLHVRSFEHRGGSTGGEGGGSGGNHTQARTNAEQCDATQRGEAGRHARPQGGGRAACKRLNGCRNCFLAQNGALGFGCSLLLLSALQIRMDARVQYIALSCRPTSSTASLPRREATRACGPKPEKREGGAGGPRGSSEAWALSRKAKRGGLLQRALSEAAVVAAAVSPPPPRVFLPPRRLLRLAGSSGGTSRKKREREKKEATHSQLQGNAERRICCK